MGDGRVNENLGGCCASEVTGQCLGYCCHSDLYYWPMAGMVSSNGDRLLVLADLVEDSLTWPDLGWCRGTHVVTVSNVRSASDPSEWEYSTSSWPGATTECNGP